ncbi:hypothetical protein CW745_08760 [Psychromonas sp. psych-6C06]|uniref:hypothetical protein n=1 Tax=Psychromonas sp. psych-6C06 TaxID=2058089 RepID=UPI000C31D686|nr:hypothetical protein [Psychromonas sp. psych-6C06]PKF61418.1 hypothetical protein CW745_08760 [Psychromonas sp. psych-6C06]
MKHICFSITAHGFGHGAISCSVINCLMAQYPHIKISVMTLLPKAYLDSRLAGEFDYYPMGSDFGMLMATPIEIDIENSRQKYQTLYENWQSYVETEKDQLATMKADMLISNISPISLDAAHQLGIQTASVAPFNWAQIYQAYCLNEERATQAVYRKMMSVYEKVDQVFKPLPFVPLGDGKEIEIASINDQPVAQMDVLLSKLPKSVKKIGLLALGGLPFPLDLAQWPEIESLHWLVDQTPPSARADMTQIGQLNLPFLSLIACSDLIITKPGYGTYCEIAALAKYKKVRVLSLQRPDWPETPYLKRFLSRRVPFVEVSQSQLKGESLRQVIIEINQVEYPDEMSCQSGAQQLVKALSIL